MHVPVLVAEILACLDPKPGDTYLDLTAGYGGHAKAIVGRTNNADGAVLVDRDPNAIKSLQALYADGKPQIIQADFLRASRQLEAEGRSFDLILADLGVSSPHLNDTSRGFAINAEGPLDMRMDTNQSLTAAEIVNTYSADDLADILRRYGEEPKANRIANLIVQGRPFETTSQLSQTVAKAWPGHSKIHPATRTFQAIRIAVNDELGQISESLPVWIDLLAPGGRIAVVSFHSLEDRLVKQAFQDESGDRYDAQLELLTKHPVVAGKEELVTNPRARSAKLRAAVKIKKKGMR
ncbi:MAG TPA: 16S rRNA (cytosine(1402)-N(4))-methyltransferase RsmH [Candidatus Saccharimonadales bacterium]|nr:16S rRNA (cytosine(1402)-N(4))-methyltransferase RsmH [Candidatus Saccharimonadales bacterium]